MTLDSQFLYKKLLPFADASRWLVAYSGGVDSHLLLHLLAELKKQQPQLPELLVVHINHQLQSESVTWARHCQQQCDVLGLPLLIKVVDVKEETRQGLEKQARDARYQAFDDILEAGDVLLLGHHQDDQVETLLLRLLRGSGSAGLSAMPASRSLGNGKLFRPLLDVSRAQIVQMAQQKKLQWIEDPSNQRDDVDRNFLRLNVLPILAERWPGYGQPIARACALSQESLELHRELAELDAKCLSLNLQGHACPLDDLKSLSPARQKNLLRYWLSQRNAAIPSASQIQAILNEVVAAQEDAEPLVRWANMEARRFDGKLVVMPALPAFDTAQQLIWQGDRCHVPGSGELTVESVKGLGLCPTQPLSIRFRQGGERCQPVGRSGSQTLKKLFQEYRVPTWLRERVPLLYRGDELVAVAGYWVCEGFQACEDEEGWLIKWQPEQ